jgi:hypothetical protein
MEEVIPVGRVAPSIVRQDDERAACFLIETVPLADAGRAGPGTPGAA